jgi:hypothetical protein
MILWYSIAAYGSTGWNFRILPTRKTILPDPVIFDQISKQQQYLPHFESILDGHLSRHFLPASFCLEIEITT